MGRIGNRFFVSTIEDGQNLHGNLASTAPLTQAMVDGTVTPNWGTLANQPTVYLTLLLGASYETVDDNSAKWFFDGTELTFDSKNENDNNTWYKGFFKKGSYSINGKRMPALTLIKNFAGAAGAGLSDLFTITCTATKTISNFPTDLSASIQLRIASLAKDSSLGVITFYQGISNITAADGKVKVFGTLYGEKASGDWWCKWYLNDEVHGTVTKNNAENTITADDVTDHAVVRCDFYDNSGCTGNPITTAYGYVDDMQDKEYMQVMYNEGGGNAAMLHKNETANFDVWVSTTSDPAVYGETVEGTFTPFYRWIYVKLVKSDGTVYTDDISGINNVVKDGWRPLSYSTSTYKHSIAITYDTANLLGRDMTGLLMATDTQLTNS